MAAHAIPPEKFHWALYEGPSSFAEGFTEGIKRTGIILISNVTDGEQTFCE